jgi:hypothetical protein
VREYLRKDASYTDALVHIQDANEVGVASCNPSLQVLIHVYNKDANEADAL